MSLEGVVNMAFFALTASGSVVISFGTVTDKLVVAIGVVATYCFGHLSAVVSLEGVIELAFSAVIASGNVFITFGIRADEIRCCHWRRGHSLFCSPMGSYAFGRRGQVGIYYCHSLRQRGYLLWNCDR